MSKSQMQQSATSLHVLEFPHDKEDALFEKDIEARLQELTNLVESFGHATFSLLITEKRAVREQIEELVVKEAALRWIVRVAKYSNGPVRDKLWADIYRALIDLEKTAESVTHAACSRL
jgi:hypothetical protein